MTTVTAKILTEVYGLAADSFKFEILYMPMDSGEFKNDLYAEVVFSLFKKSSKMTQSWLGAMTSSKSTQLMEN